MRRILATGLLVLVAGLLVPALAFAYSSRAADSAPSGAVAMADDGDSEANAAAKPWVGLYLGNLNENLADRLGLDREDGVVVLKVVKDGPADDAGVEQADIILRVDGQDVAVVKDVAVAVGALSPGDTITLGVLRGADEQDIAVTVGERPHPKRAKRGASGPLRLLAPMAGNLLRAEITFADADGNPVTLAYVAGTVTGLDGDAITVEPKDGGDDLALTVTDDTKVVKGRKGGDGEGLAVGDSVVVLWKDGTLVAIVALPTHARGAAQKRGGHRFRGALGGLALIRGHDGTPGFRPGAGSLMRQLPRTLGGDPRGWAPGTWGSSRGPRGFGGGELGRAPAPDSDLQQRLQRLSQELEGILAS